jgi:exosome complex component RRP46
MAAVYGPQQVLARKEDVDKLAIEVCWRPPFGLQTPADVERETTLRRTLEQIVLTSQMPRLGIRVVVQVIAQDGSLEACAMNATCHALMDAGIPMFGTLVAAGRRRRTRHRAVRGPDGGRGTRQHRARNLRVLLPRR